MMPKIGTMLVVGLCILSTPRLAPCQETGALPTWEPSGARSKRLAAESKFDGWTIRPPQGHPHRTNKAANETRTAWAKQPEGAIIVIQAHVDLGQTTLEQGLERYLSTLKGRLKKFGHTPFERGLINGKTFMRTRFSAEGLPGVSGKGYGFAYVTLDTKTPFSVTGFGTEASIQDLEASALTFRALE